MVHEVFNNSGLVWIQGVQVQITSDAINDYFQTLTDRNEVYDEGFRISDNFHPQLRAMAAALRQNGSDMWVPGTTELLHGELEPDMALWTVFIKHSLVPSTHRTVVSLETARILYAIMTGVQIDVGYFIFNSILKTGCDTRCLLNFPCLITHFCRIAGIMGAFNEAETEAPPADIGKKAYNSFCTRHGLPNLAAGGRHRNRRRQGDAAHHQNPHQLGAGPYQGGGYYDNPPPWGANIIHQVAEVREEQRRTNERLDRVVDYRHHGTTYQRRNMRDDADPSSSRYNDHDDE